jgi:hypothetical protein
MKPAFSAALLAVASLDSAASDWQHDFDADLRLDVLATELEGDVTGALRRYYDPASVPIGGAAEWSGDAHAAFSTLAWRAARRGDSGTPLRFHVEADFLDGDPEDGDADGDYGVSLRHAYVAFGGPWRSEWLVGQTWSGFMDLRALPEGVDPFGASDGSPFRRQAQLRVTRGHWSASLEQAETTLNPLGGGARRTDSGGVPDVVVRYTRDGRAGHWSAALLLRELAYEGNGIDDDVVGTAFALSGSVAAGDDGRWMGGIVFGQGFGRYVGLGATADVNVELDAEIEEVEGTALHVGYAHRFGDRWRANAYYSRADWDNADEISGGGAIDHTQSFAANVVFTISEGLELGAELRWGERVTEDGAGGELLRAHAVVRYAFD